MLCGGSTVSQVLEDVVESPAVYVEQLVANLVHNAVSHNDPGGHVAVILSVVGREFLLGVVDDGPGVPPEHVPQLTERGFQEDPSRARGPTR